MVALSCCQYEEPSDSEKAHMKKCWHVEVPNVLVCNPVVFIGSVVFLWGFVIACCIEPDWMGKFMSAIAFEWIPEVWTWLYIVSQDFWVIVLLWGMVMYGDLKLGKDDEEPIFSLATWFALLFCCGVATGFFYYAVAEPMWHFKGWGNPRFISGAKGYGTSDEDGIHALMVTIFHWGVHGWIAYTVMGAVLAIMTYRRGFPMTIRYCFWPLIGERCYGWMGDVVDALSIVTSIAGVCTSLGIGAMSINTGMQRLNHGFFRGVNYNIPDEAKYSEPDCGGHGKICSEGKEAYGIQYGSGEQIIIILIITCMATCSVVLGLSTGIKFISQVVFFLGNGLMLIILLSGETYFCLDAMVQTLGYYIWYIVRIGFITDAFERLGDKNLGLGGNPDGVRGGAGWLTAWTLFYWGWWISWGPLVGTFLAKISRGRTLRTFIAGTLIVPTLYCVVWFGVWGSEGIRMQRMADGSGLCGVNAVAKNTSFCAQPKEGQLSSKCRSYAGAFTKEFKIQNKIGWNPSCVLDPNYHGGYGKCKEQAWGRYTPVGDSCVWHTSWHPVPCGGAPDPTILTEKIKTGCKKESEDAKLYNLHPPDQQAPCFVPAQDGLVCLYNQATEDILFDQISTYGSYDFSYGLCLLALVCLTLYFVTSSDSGSLVVDILSANGHPEPPLPQRVFWSFTEGATAIALLLSGMNSPNPNAALKALQSASIICGLPYTFIMFWCCQSLVLLVQEETNTLDRNRKCFSHFIFNITLCKEHAMNYLIPGVRMGKAVSILGKWPLSGFGQHVTMIIWATIFQATWVLAVICLLASPVGDHWLHFAIVLFSAHGVLCGLVRNEIRSRCKVEHGDLMTDFICGIFAPGFTVSQMVYQLENDKLKDDTVANEEVTADC